MNCKELYATSNVEFKMHVFGTPKICREWQFLRWYPLSLGSRLTFWRRNYFFLILAHPVYKIRITQEPNTLEL